MPQKKSYFALQLPKRWWIFGLDLALHGDIDSYQFKFFSELVKDKVSYMFSSLFWYVDGISVLLYYALFWIIIVRRFSWNDKKGRHVKI